MSQETAKYDKHMAHRAFGLAVKKQDIYNRHSIEKRSLVTGFKQRGLKKKQNYGK